MADCGYDDASSVVSYISSNPSTVSEARDPGSMRDFRYEINSSRVLKIDGIVCLGFCRALKYRYEEPETSISSYFSDFLVEYNLSEDQVEGPSVETLSSEFRPPSLSDFKKHLESFGVGRPDGESVSLTLISKALARMDAAEFDLPVIDDWLRPDAVFSVRVPYATSPGVRWKKLGYLTKKDALPSASVEASEVIDRIISDDLIYQVPPCSVGGRGKRTSILEGASGEARKEGRLILIPDLVRHLVGSLASQPLTKSVRHCSKVLGGVLLGGSPFYGMYDKIAKWTSSSIYFFFLDFKGFDQSLSARAIILAFQHIRAKFSDCDGADTYWEAEYLQLVHTRIVLPSGYVYTKGRGVASGDPWTSLVGSYANWLMLETVLLELGVIARVWTFGDDSIIAIDSGGIPTLEALSYLLYERWGVTVSTKKSYGCERLLGLTDTPMPAECGSFLSNYFCLDGGTVVPIRPIQDLYELMIIPERNKGTVEWEIARTCMAYITFYFNPEARFVIESYWDYLHDTYEVIDLKKSWITSELRYWDIPWDSFRLSWLVTLPNHSEVLSLYMDKDVRERRSPISSGSSESEESGPSGIGSSLLTERNLLLL